MNNLFKVSILALFVFTFSTASSQTISSSVPEKIDPKGKYLFYLHGRIIEDQGVTAVSPEFGTYEYQKILDTFKIAGFHVISEPRPQNTDVDLYADKVVLQIKSLIKAKVAAENITIVGASKGAGITIKVSEKLRNEKVNFVIMGICNEDYYQSREFDLYGRVLSIYENSDSYGGACDKLFQSSPHVQKSKELALEMGNGHGFLYKPYKEWVVPAIQWANDNSSMAIIK